MVSSNPCTNNEDSKLNHDYNQDFSLEPQCVLTSTDVQQEKPSDLEIKFKLLLSLYCTQLVS